MIIQPTVGRTVWFYPDHLGLGKPLAAMVTEVHGDRDINLTVFSACGGITVGYQNVRLAQEGDPVADGPCACWMPYQHEQAKRHALREVDPAALEMARYSEPSA